MCFCCLRGEELPGSVVWLWKPFLFHHICITGWLIPHQISKFLARQWSPSYLTAGFPEPQISQAPKCFVVEVPSGVTTLSPLVSADLLCHQKTQPGSLLVGNLQPASFYLSCWKISQQRLLKPLCGPGLEGDQGPRSLCMPGFSQLHLPVAKVSAWTSTSSKVHSVDRPGISSPPTQKHNIYPPLLKSFISLNNVSYFLHQILCIFQ